MAVIVTATALTVVGTVGGAIAGDRASRREQEGIERGGERELQLGRENIALQEQLNAEQREDFAPWRDVGEQALNELWTNLQAGEYDAGNVNVQDDPSYQFRLDEANKGLERSAAARGGLLSGAQMKALTRYNQDYASTEYANSYARNLNEKNRQFNMLAGLSDAGQNSAARQAGATAQLASNVGNILTNQGQTVNQTSTNAARARADGYRDISTSLNQGAENFLTQQGLSRRSAPTLGPNSIFY